ncbi:MAG: N-acetylglucosaminidase [Anaerorhabdus sp.]
MKKIVKGLLTLLLTLSSIQFAGLELFDVVSAAQDYPLYCGNSFEVSIANANGTFSKVSCVSTFADAKKAMEANGINAVVRHTSSYSPMKIIAMNSGVAISYPMRSGSTTLTVTQDIVHTYRKTTYVTKHREMKYDTTYNYSSGDGSILINITGFSGTVSLKNVDLIPSIFIDNEIAVLLGGNDTTAANESPFWTHVYRAHYTVTQNGNYTDLVFKAYSGWSGASTYPDVYSMVVGSAADWMKVGETYYSYDGYTFYSDYSYKNLVGTYYNYYQFLPLRSTTGISASTFDAFLASVKGTNTNSKLKNQGSVFIDAQNTYGVNALLVYALACLESAYGTSAFALERNNLFGWNAFDSDPGQASYFSSIEAAVKEHMGINLRGYLNIDDARFFGSHVGNKGSGFNVKYAADPYWGYKIAAIAYEIDKFANNYNGNLVDDKVTVGLINTYGVDVMTTSGGSTVLYNSKYGATYQENFMVVMLEENSDWTKIQSTNPVVNGKIVNGTTTGLVGYNWENSVGYLATQYVTALTSTDDISVVGEEPTGDFVSEVKGFSATDGILTVSGEAYRPGIYVTADNTVTQTVTMINQSNSSVAYDATSTVTDNDKISYKTTIDLSKLEIGQYYFKVKTNYGKLSEYSNEFILRSSDLSFETITIGEKEYSATVEGDMIYLVVKKVEEVVDSSDKLLKQDILTFTYDETSQEMKLTGYAFISGMDAKKTTNVVQELYLLNLETGVELPFKVVTTSLDKPISFNDGYEYSKISYSATLNLESVEMANYALMLRVTNGSIEKTAELKNYYTQIKPKDFSIGDTQYRFVINQLYGYRYELQIENSQLNFSKVKKPTVRNSSFDFTTITLNEGKVSIKGIAWIYNADSSSKTNPKYQLVLVDSNGTVTEQSLTTTACAIDYTGVLGLSFDTSKACFEGDVSLSSLASGNYRMYLSIETASYYDVFEMYDFYGRSITSNTWNGKTYSIANSAVRKRLILTVK